MASSGMTNRPDSIIAHHRFRVAYAHGETSIAKGNQRIQTRSGLLKKPSSTGSPQRAIHHTSGCTVFACLDRGQQYTLRRPRFSPRAYRAVVWGSRQDILDVSAGPMHARPSLPSSARRGHRRGRSRLCARGRGRARGRRHIAGLGRRSRARYLIAFRIHALHVRDVVAPLQGPARPGSGLGPAGRPNQETTAGADGGAYAGIAGRGAESRTCSCPQQCS
jgi:hypothetical protein